MPNTEKIKIIGGYPLRGSIEISGSKNAALPLVVSSILSDEDLILTNLPDLSDIKIIIDILKEFNVKIEKKKGSYIFNGRDINNFSASYDLVSLMRASTLVLGPLLSKYHSAKIPLPGGCSIGMRPIDLHIKALEKMGAEVIIEHGNIVASCKNGLKGADITFDIVSVGATEHIMMAAVLAKGTTILRNVAKEPEIVDLARCLNKMGAKVKGAGEDIIEIKGVSSLKKASHKVIGDRIEAGSYAMAALATKGDLTLKNIEVDMLDSLFDCLKQIGANIEIISFDSFNVSTAKRLNALDIITNPYPYFPTDLQSIWMSLMSVSDGVSNIKENIFENRFSIVPELLRMGANIEVKDQFNAKVQGVERLNSAEVKATDLRAAFALILAALAAEGETTISKLHHLDRGYSNVPENLISLGAKIKRGVNI